MSGCAVKPVEIIQTSQTLTIELNKPSQEQFEIIGRNGKVIAEQQAENNKISFSLPYYTSDSECYRVQNSKGQSLLTENEGISLTLTSIYQQSAANLQILKQRKEKLDKQTNQNERQYANANAQMKRHSLYSNPTCRLPAEKPIPPFPDVLCRTEEQCERLANKVCTDNIIDAEKCGVALSRTNTHSSITSMSCGVIVASLNKQRYGIDSVVADAFTGYLDQHTKNMIESGEYGKGILTLLSRVLFTTMRKNKCKTSFAQNAFRPVREWSYTRDRIKREPYQKRDECYGLIRANNRYLKQSQESQKALTSTTENYEVAIAETARIKEQRTPVQSCIL